MTDPNYAQWLVASDIDGTLNNKKRRLPQKNLEAIKEFVDKGGKFTLASGRNPQSMRRHYRNLPLKNIPAVVINGAGIYDYDKEQMIYFSPLSQKSMEAACEVAKQYPTVDAIIVARDMIYVTGFGLWGFIFVHADKLTHKYVRNIDNVPKENWGKVLFSGPPWRVRSLKKKLSAMQDTDFYSFDSSIASVEMMKKGTNKGSAILKLAEMLGIDKNKTAGIGDYYNDYGMLASVAVPGTCFQAPRAIKEISEYVACHCDRGAVADFLNYLIKEKIEK